jgi:ribosomal protein L35
MKTNKSFSKRIRVTKSGKLLTRTPGGNHFNAKESRSKQLNRKAGSVLVMKNKDRGRYMPGV